MGTPYRIRRSDLALATSNKNGSIVSFAKLGESKSMPHFLEVQLEAFDRLRRDLKAQASHDGDDAASA